MRSSLVAPVVVSSLQSSTSKLLLIVYLSCLYISEQNSCSGANRDPARASQWH